MQLLEPHLIEENFKLKKLDRFNCKLIRGNVDTRIKKLKKDYMMQ